MTLVHHHHHLLLLIVNSLTPPKLGYCIHRLERMWETVEIAIQKVSDRLIELAEIKPGQKVLDIATGIGEPALTAARKVVELASSSYDKKSDDDNNRNRGHVLATDISTQMLTIAKQRAAAVGLQDVIEPAPTYICYFTINNFIYIIFGPKSYVKFDSHPWALYIRVHVPAHGTMW